MTPKQIEAQLRDRAARALLERGELQARALAHLNPVSPGRRRPRAAAATAVSPTTPRRRRLSVREQLDHAAAALEHAVAEAHREAMATPLAHGRLLAATCDTSTIDRAEHASRILRDLRRVAQRDEAIAGRSVA